MGCAKSVQGKVGYLTYHNIVNGTITRTKRRYGEEQLYASLDKQLPSDITNNIGAYLKMARPIVKIEEVTGAKSNCDHFPSSDKVYKETVGLLYPLGFSGYHLYTNATCAGYCLHNYSYGVLDGWTIRWRRLEDQNSYQVITDKYYNLGHLESQDNYNKNISVVGIGRYANDYRSINVSLAIKDLDPSSLMVSGSNFVFVNKGITHYLPRVETNKVLAKRYEIEQLISNVMNRDK